MPPASGLLASEIAAAVRGAMEGDGQVRVQGAAGLDEASSAEISFFHNPKYGEQLEKTKAGIILIPENNNFKFPSGKTIIRVPNPPLAFAQVLSLFERQRARHPAPGIHPQAVVHPTAHVAADAAVGALAVIAEGARIGAKNIIYSGCHIGAGVQVGENCLIYPNVVAAGRHADRRPRDHSAWRRVGSDGYGFATQNGVHHKIPQIGKVVIEDDVEVGANVTIRPGHNRRDARGRRAPRLIISFILVITSRSARTA
jgi:UDP-3-O-[3-hydroxymyristoyl] glucosamine N-acyltransferase